MLKNHQLFFPLQKKNPHKNHLSTSPLGRCWHARLSEDSSQMLLFAAGSGRPGRRRLTKEIVIKEWV